MEVFITAIKIVFSGKTEEVTLVKGDKIFIAPSISDNYVNAMFNGLKFSIGYGHLAEYTSAPVNKISDYSDMELMDSMIPCILGEDLVEADGHNSSGYPSIFLANNLI